MKYLALMGSPRKHWNTDQMLDSFLEGIKAQDADAMIEKVYVYDLDFKGCRGCLGCNLKSTPANKCVFPDGAVDLINKTKEVDGVILASPVYYFTITAELRAFMERVWFSSRGKKPEKIIRTACIYTMNQPKENMEKYFRKDLNEINMFMKNTFGTDPIEVMSFDTRFVKNIEPYEMKQEEFERKKAHYETNFNDDLKNAYEEGRRIAQ